MDQSLAEGFTRMDEDTQHINPLKRKHELDSAEDENAHNDQINDENPHKRARTESENPNEQSENDQTLQNPNDHSEEVPTQTNGNLITVNTYDNDTLINSIAFQNFSRSMLKWRNLQTKFTTWLLSYDTTLRSWCASRLFDAGEQLLRVLAEHCDSKVGGAKCFGNIIESQDLIEAHGTTMRAKINDKGPISDHHVQALEAEVCEILLGKQHVIALHLSMTLAALLAGKREGLMADAASTSSFDEAIGCGGPELGKLQDDEIEAFDVLRCAVFWKVMRSCRAVEGVAEEGFRDTFEDSVDSFDEWFRDSHGDIADVELVSIGRVVFFTLRKMPFKEPIYVSYVDEDEAKEDNGHEGNSHQDDEFEHEANEADPNEYDTQEVNESEGYESGEDDTEEDVLEDYPTEDDVREWEGA